ncbi:MAG: ATP-binding protein [Desulfobacterales bacterium]|nr:ATP-binding protein [Desulfobacterales bacterium]
MFRTINSKFYATAILLLVILGCGYGFLNFFLSQQDRLASQMMETTVAEKEIRALRSLFYEIRFWQTKILEGDTPEANSKFGMLIRETREKLDSFQQKEPGELLKPGLNKITESMAAYEHIFNDFVQLKTRRNIHRTVMDTGYQSLVSNILNTGRENLFKPLFNLSHFFINYVMQESEHVYNALILVADYLGKKIKTSDIHDTRTLDYLVSFQEMIRQDYTLSLDIKKVKQNFDTENTHLTSLFDQVFDQSARLFESNFREAENRRNTLNQMALALTVIFSISILFLIFFFSRSIVRPIRTVAGVMHEVRAGNPGARVVIKGRRDDELIRFSRHFNATLDSLQLSEEKYKYLFKFAIDAIVLMDDQGGITDCSPSALQMFGFKKKEDIHGIGPLDLSPTHQADGTLSEEKATEIIEDVRTKGTALFEWIHQRRNGDTFSANVLVTRILIGGRTVVQATIRDISETKQAQEMMIQSEKMLSVGGLAAGMAHEINNPLAGLLQTAELMTRRLSRTDMPANLSAAEDIGITPDQIKTYMENRGIFNMLETIRSSGIRMADIISNMLSFARKSDASATLEYLPDLLDKTLDLATTDFDLKKKYDFKNIRIIREYADNLPLVQCESAKIQQVFLNILRNGAQAMQDNHIIDPELRLTVCKQVSFIVVKIRDNGPGMDAGTRKRVFEPFFTTKPVGIGTGLGLSVSYFIITDNHKGQMRVESEPGHGSTFIISLPLNNS